MLAPALARPRSSVQTRHGIIADQYVNRFTRIEQRQRLGAALGKQHRKAGILKPRGEGLTHLFSSSTSSTRTASVSSGLGARAIGCISGVSSRSSVTGSHIVTTVPLPACS